MEDTFWVAGCGLCDDFVSMTLWSPSVTLRRFLCRVNQSQAIHGRPLNATHVIAMSNFRHVVKSESRDNRAMDFESIRITCATQREEKGRIFYF